MLTTRNRTKTGTPSFAEVWYDVVSPRHLLISIFIALVLGLTSYVVGRHVLRSLFPNLSTELVGGYALFLGVAGCVVAGLVAGILFKPKRILVEATVDETQILDVLREEGMTTEEEIVALEALPENVRAELKEVGAYDRILRILRSHSSPLDQRGKD